MWTTWIEGDEARLEAGWPLDSLIASVVGYDVAHEDWPGWIDEWVEQILGRPESSS